MCCFAGAAEIRVTKFQDPFYTQLHLQLNAGATPFSFVSLCVILRTDYTNSKNVMNENLIIKKKTETSAVDKCELFLLFFGHYFVIPRDIRARSQNSHLQAIKQF